MRNLSTIKAVHDDCKCQQQEKCIELTKWLKQANSDDLHALYSGEVTNGTPYKFHDLMFNLHYSDKTARFYRESLLTNFRALIAGEITVQQIQADAAALDILL